MRVSVELGDEGDIGPHVRGGGQNMTRSPAEVIVSVGSNARLAAAPLPGDSAGAGHFDASSLGQFATLFSA